MKPIERLKYAGVLREALLARSDVFVATFTERLMQYALGRELAASDMPIVCGVVRAAEAEHHTLRALVQALVASDSFQKRVKAGAEPVPN